MKNLQENIKKYLRFFKKVFNNNNICIIGIDGTGKSSTIKELNNIFNEEFQIQYMGNKNWETKIAKKKKNNKSSNVISLSNLPIVFIKGIEFYYRALKHYPYSYNVLFDRYAWENALNLEIKRRNDLKFKIKKMLYDLIFIKFFPKPKYCFYLTCETSTSVNRKDDLNSKELIDKIKMMKIVYDDYFTNRDDTIIINTDYLSSKETVNLIIESLPKSFLHR